MLTANDLLQFIGTENYYKCLFKNILHTDGVNFLNQNGLAWFIDVIGSHIICPVNSPAKTVLAKERKELGMVFFTLNVRENKTWRVEFSDGDSEGQLLQEGEFTDCPLSELKVYASFGNGDGTCVLMLSSEY
jgi:hypothetical protein